MSLAEATETTLFYFVIVGVFYMALVVLIGAPVCFLRHRFEVRPALRALWRFFAFLVLLLGVGAIAQNFWTTAIWGHFYYSTDYVYGYMPFLPMTQWTIDLEFAGQRGALNGISLTTLNLIWLSVTIPVWALTIWAYRRVFGVTTSRTETPHFSPA